jgi:hypothetical protein
MKSNEELWERYKQSYCNEYILYSQFCLAADEIRKEQREMCENRLVFGIRAYAIKISQKHEKMLSELIKNVGMGK